MNTKYGFVVFGIGVALLSMPAAIGGQEQAGAGNRLPGAGPRAPPKPSDRPPAPGGGGVGAAASAVSVSLTSRIPGGGFLDVRLREKEIRRRSRIVDPPDGLL